MPKVLRPPVPEIEITRPTFAQSLKILVYGSAGSGKTVFAGTANLDERTAPTLFVDFEAGTLSLAGQDIDVDVIRVTHFKQFNDVYAMLSAEDCPYRCVVVDSITEVQKLNLGGIVAESVRAQPGRDPDRPLIDDWGKSAEQMRKLLRRFRDLPMHVIVTALAQEVKDESDGSVRVKPALPGKLADEIAAMFDFVIYLDVATEKADGEYRHIRRGLTVSTGRYIAKDRSGRLAAVVDDPSVTSILDYVLAFGTV